MRRVDPRTHTPVPATILIVVIGVILMAALPGAAQLELIAASTVLLAIVYGATIALYLAVRKRLDRKKGAFDLGRFELPVAIGALTWSVAPVSVLVAPAEALVPVLVVAGLLIGGGLYFVGLLVFNREVLQTEPGDVNAFMY
jgi:amino acid transporter